MAYTCPSCGMVVQASAVFCDNCGVKLPDAAARLPAGMLACLRCGHSNVPGAVFCENCGALLAAPAEPPPPAAPTIPSANQMTHQPTLRSPGHPTLTGRLFIPTSGASIPIPPGKSEAIIGREDPISGVFPEIDLEPHDGLNHGIGRRHAKLTCQEGQIYIEDLNSVNYTHLRGQKLVPGQKYPLQDGDELVLGKMKLIYFKS